MANLSSFFPSTESGGGGAFPRKVTFSSSDTWSVPTVLQDAITADGGVNVGLTMVGAGNSTRSGEVINEVYRLTSDDYNSGTTNVAIIIGASGGDTGLKSVPNTNTGTVTGSAAGFNLNESNQVAYLTTSQTPKKSGSAPYIYEITFPQLTSGGGSWSVTTAFSGNSSPTFSGFTTNPTQDTSDRNRFYFGSDSADPDAGLFDGTITLTQTGTTSGASGFSSETVTLSWDDTNNRFKFLWSTNWASGLPEGSMTGHEVEYQLPDSTRKTARGAASTDYDYFPNNPTSTDGFLGYARHNGKTYGSGGTNPQGGYVEILYFE